MEDEIAYLIEQGASWVVSQREAHRSSGLALPPQAGLIFEPFFGDETIGNFRIRFVPIIENPEFYGEMAASGRRLPIDFTVMHGITFGDTVLFSRKYVAADSLRMGLLFHELVHVVQYELLGIDEFVRRYITGWAENGFEYRSIPMEQDAYELEDRFVHEPNVEFSVHHEVSKRLDLAD